MPCERSDGDRNKLSIGECDVMTLRMRFSSLDDFYEVGSWLCSYQPAVVFLFFGDLARKKVNLPSISWSFKQNAVKN